MVKRPRVILADDHKLVAEALHQLIAAQFDVVAIASDGHELLRFAKSLKPDVIVVDIAMPLLNGLEAGRQLKEEMPGVKLVFLTMNEDADLALEAMNAGASAYVLKQSAATELLDALGAAIRGKSYVTRQIARRMQESFAHNPHGRSRPRSVTPRQRQVVQLLAEGKSMKEAADVLNVTPRTVAFHKYRLMRDLGLKTTAEVVQYAIKNRIVV